MLKCCNLSKAVYIYICISVKPWVSCNLLVVIAGVNCFRENVCNGA